MDDEQEYDPWCCNCGRQKSLHTPESVSDGLCGNFSADRGKGMQAIENCPLCGEVLHPGLCHG